MCEKWQYYQFETKGTCFRMNILCDKFECLTWNSFIYNFIIISGFKVYIKCGNVLSIGDNFKQMLLMKFMFAFFLEVF